MKNGVAECVASDPHDPNYTVYIFFPNQEKILEQPSLATLDATQLKEPAIFYQASTCDHEVDTTSQENLDFGAEINKSE